MTKPFFLAVLALVLGLSGAASASPSDEALMCQDTRTKLVRAFKTCPKGTVEVFPLIKSTGGGHWSANGYWVGQVAPRVDQSPPDKHSEQDARALQNLLGSTPPARMR